MKALAACCLVLAVLVVWLWLDRAQATARADQLLTDLGQAETRRLVERDSILAVVAARSAASQAHVQTAHAATAAADTQAAARSGQEEAVAAALAALSETHRQTLETDRAQFRAEVRALRLANIELDAAHIQDSLNLVDLRRQLVLAEANLAVAIGAAQASETARRGGPFAWGVRALALVGSVVLLDRAVCGIGHTQLLLPCG